MTNKKPLVMVASFVAVVQLTAGCNYHLNDSGMSTGRHAVDDNATTVPRDTAVSPGEDTPRGRPRR